jgi:hypothetical protein
MSRRRQPLIAALIGRPHRPADWRCYYCGSPWYTLGLWFCAARARDLLVVGCLACRSATNGGSPEFADTELTHERGNRR